MAGEALRHDFDRQARSERIYTPRRGLNDISALSKSYYVRSFTRHKRVRPHRTKGNIMRIYFLHIPKTAGTSVHDILVKNRGDAVCPHRLYDDLTYAKLYDLNDYNVISGHFGISLMAILPKPIFTFTFLRDPVARTLSHFMHVKRDSNHPYHDYTSRMSISDFICDPITIPLVYNFQSRYLSFQLTGFDCVSHFSRDYTKSGELSVTWELMSYGMSDRDIREIALKSVFNIDFIGFVDEFDISIRRLSEILKFDNRIASKTNLSPNTNDVAGITSDVKDRILALNLIDLEVYNMAKSLYGEMRGKIV
jgi:Sulfotransferase family